MAFKGIFGSKAPAPGWAADGRSDGGADEHDSQYLRLASSTSQQELVDKVFSMFTPDGLLCEEVTLGAGGAVLGVGKSDAWATTWAVNNATLYFYNTKRDASVRFAFALRDVSGSTSFFGRYLLPGAPSPTWMIVLREAGAATLTPDLLACKVFQYSSWRHTMGVSFTLAPNGFVTGSGGGVCEVAWGVEDGCLALHHGDGRRSCIFPLVVSGTAGELVLAGAFAIPDNTSGAWHFLAEVKGGSDAAAGADADTTAEAAAVVARVAAATLRSKLSGRSFRYENSDRVLSPVLTLDYRGFITGLKHINETCWNVSPEGELRFKHANGDVTARFPLVSGVGDVLQF